MSNHEIAAMQFIKDLWGKGLYTKKNLYDRTEILSSKPYYNSDERIHIKLLCGRYNCSWEIKGRKLIIK